MITAPAFVVVDSTSLPAARCFVCGGGIADGEGFAARYQDRTLRLRCSDCVSLFLADPDRYLAKHSDVCCRETEAEGSPASEWACD